jgi:hypothetical protein
MLGTAFKHLCCKQHKTEHCNKYSRNFDPPLSHKRTDNSLYIWTASSPSHHTHRWSVILELNFVLFYFVHENACSHVYIHTHTHTHMCYHIGEHGVQWNRKFLSYELKYIQHTYSPGTFFTWSAVYFNVLAPWCYHLFTEDSVRKLKNFTM